MFRELLCYQFCFVHIASVVAAADGISPSSATLISVDLSYNLVWTCCSRLSISCRFVAQLVVQCNMLHVAQEVHIKSKSVEFGPGT